jgi:hypothetical protein
MKLETLEVDQLLKILGIKNCIFNHYKINLSPAAGNCGQEISPTEELLRE